MIPNNRSLVPLSRERQAAIQAIMYVEQKAGRRLYCAEYPYARAYFRFLMGSRRITLKEIRVFCPCLQESELRGRKQAWLKAIDILIASEGGCCPLPLSCHDAGWVFPEKRFQQTERRRMKRELHAEKYSASGSGKGRTGSGPTWRKKARPKSTWPFTRRRRSRAGCPAGRNPA